MSRTGSCEDVDVLIVGAGIAGTAAARAMYRKGRAALVIDRRSETDDGLAINLPGNAIAALQALGLGGELKRYGRPVRRREYRTHRGRLLFAVDEERFWGPELTPRCMRRADLLTMLSSDLPSAAFRRGLALSAINDCDGRVQVELSDGSRLSTKLLIGADGVNSATRSALFGATQPAAARLAHASWRFMVPDPGVECWTLWASPAAMLLLIPAGSGEVYGWAAATGRDQGTADLPSLGSLFAQFPALAQRAVAAALSNPSSLHHSPLEEVRLRRWGEGRTVLIGDAAHATAPVWAQGAALAMEDAIILADALTDHPDSIVASFEARRRARVEHVQRMTDRMSKAAELPIAVRNLLLPFLGPKSYRATYGPLKTTVF